MGVGERSSHSGRGSNLDSKRRTLNPPSPRLRRGARPTSNLELRPRYFPALDVRRWAFDVFRLQTDLVHFIRDEICQLGPVSFAWFMEQALYHPEYGYYSSNRAEIGHGGDYFTNVSVGALFGELLTVQFAEIWERLGQTDNFVIVEQGAHHGQFARDVLESARSRFPDFFSSFRYCIVEPFSRLQDRQAQALRQFGNQVQWCRSLNELEPFVGIHFSNELLDSAPVHLLVSTEGGWQEKFVGFDSDDFLFVNRPIVDPKLEEIATRLPTHPPGYETEINLAILEWIEHLAGRLQCGLVLAIDYGLARENFYAGHRNTGSLQVRAKHRLLASPFEQIGAADLSAHVNWTSLAEQAEQCGLQIAGFTDQHHFFTGIVSEFGRGDSPEPPAADSRQSLLPFDFKAKREVQTLLHPEMLGRSFQVLALAKDMDFSVPLGGFKFARNARAALGL
jgi:SAM-dependent MidA family methyltransferase